ncbi:ATP-dependent Clp protease ATP-binding subunit [Actinoallomurus sp. NPDC050550]|uniref:ATP-dependent Clp protease ATP-binding subunit n=1 Tax=Actinoallomurus sp. NPDC050550 TaxID=3154937 RepID=UPI0033C82903
MANRSTGFLLAIELARLEAMAGGSTKIEAGHLLMGLTKLCRADIGEVLQRPGTVAQRSDLRAVEEESQRLRRRFATAGVDPDRLRRRLRAVHVVGPRLTSPTDLRLGRTVLRRADDLAGQDIVDAVALLRAVLENLTSPSEQVLAHLGIDDPLAAFFPRPGRRETPFLDEYGRDLTELARAGRLPPLIGRRAELRALARVLVRRHKTNAVLVGEAGVGKTGIVEGLARRLAAPDAPADLAGSRIVELSMTTLLAGAGYRGEFEERVQAVLREAGENPELILFIDELHTVLGAGGRAASDAANILKPALGRGEIRCIGATTPGEHRRHIESDPALDRRFQVIWVEEPTRAEAVEILAGLRERLADHHGVEIAREGVEAAVDLAIRFLPDLRLPDKAIDLLDEACAAARIRTLSPGAPPATEVDSAALAAVVAERVRLPVERVAASEAKRLLTLEERLRRRVIGQDEAVEVVAEAVRTSRAGLGDPRRPIGVFLFAGPTGTGKTELAKALAALLFDDERRLIRIDMSEYKERHAISRLLGAPPGYLGHDREGQLSGPLRNHPHSVVLFDEVEKAHEEVLDLFLQIFDEGSLTDARGRRVSFTDAVVILTSNLGAMPVAAHRAIGFGAAGAEDRAPATGDDPTERVMAALRTTLRPELLGRIGRVVVFKPLPPAAVRRIVDTLVDRVQERLADRAITIVLTGEAYEFLLWHADTARSGARALEQTVERLLVQPLGRALLAGRLTDDTTVRVGAAGDALTFAPVDGPKGATPS